MCIHREVDVFLFTSMEISCQPLESVLIDMTIALALKAHQTTRTAELIGNKLVTTELLSVSLSLYTITFLLFKEGYFYQYI